MMFARDSTDLTQQCNAAAADTANSQVKKPNTMLIVMDAASTTPAADNWITAQLFMHAHEATGQEGERSVACTRACV
jgi:hypothetical protein